MTVNFWSHLLPRPSCFPIQDLIKTIPKYPSLKIQSVRKLLYLIFNRSFSSFIVIKWYIWFLWWKLKYFNANRERKSERVAEKCSKVSVLLIFCPVNICYQGTFLGPLQVIATKKGYGDELTARWRCYIT